MLYLIYRFLSISLKCVGKGERERERLRGKWIGKILEISFMARSNGI